MAIAGPTAKWVGVVYGPADIKAVLQAAGFTGENLTIGTAVAQAESSGEVDVISPQNDDGTYDYGLMQINSGAHPEKFVGRDWSNPATNAVMAKQVFDEAGGRWTPWTTFNDGSYKAHLADAAAASGGGGGALPPGSPQDAVVAALDPFGDFGDAFGAVGDIIYRGSVWIADPDNWIRVLQVVVGGGLTIAALAIVARPAIGKMAGPVGKLIS